MALKAVLFDFDGVIADTENQHIAAWQRTLSVMGWQVPDEVAAQSAGVDDREFLRELFAKHSIVSDKIEDWVRRKQALFVRMLRDSPRLYPGAADLIRTLHGQVRLAIVSGTWRENIETVLGAAGLGDAIDTIVGKEDVTVVKPAPEAYRVALKGLRCSARSSVAIEDSPSGIASARAAGIRVVAVGHRRTFGDWVGDATYVTGFEPATGLLKLLRL
jgi:HAD superfamily hydrolase (TIGR01509 family)